MRKWWGVILMMSILSMLFGCGKEPEFVPRVYVLGKDVALSDIYKISVGRYGGMQATDGYNFDARKYGDRISVDANFFVLTDDGLEHYSLWVAQMSEEQWNNLVQMFDNVKVVERQKVKEPPGMVLDAIKSSSYVQWEGQTELFDTYLDFSEANVTYDEMLDYMLEITKELQTLQEE